MPDYSLNWDVDGFVDSPCPICGNKHNPCAVDLYSDKKLFSHLGRCSKCKTLYYDDQHFVGYLSLEESTGDSQKGLQKKFYVEVGVGIEAILAPLLAIPHREGKRLLDIGCGFGFSLDFWQHFMKYGQAIGLEAAEYGADGKQCFHVDIRNEYLDAKSYERLGRFDIVYACEVIEHIEDPRSFLRNTDSVLSPDGILCLTTPNAQFIRPGSDQEFGIQSLSPTQHRFLFSELALIDLLHSVGFKYVQVYVQPPRLIAWASHKPIPKLQREDAQNLTWQYIESLSSCQDLQVRGGILYRIFVDCCLTKKKEARESPLDSLRDCVLQAYGFDIYDPDEFLQEQKELENSVFYNKTPSYLGPLFLHLAQIAAHQGDRQKALAFLHRADLVLEKYQILCSILTTSRITVKKALKNLQEITPAPPAPHRKIIALIQAKERTLDNIADFTLPYTFAVMSAWIKQEYPEVEVFLADSLEKALEADEVWCSSLSEDWNNAIELGKAVTEAGKKFLVGGHHATALPETMPYGEVVRGPLEHYKKLDELPFPDWSIFPNPTARPGILMTSRGCPFACRFCSSRAFWKGYSEKSAKRVLAEIRQLAELGHTQIVIFDDLFTANKSRLKEISARVCAEGLNELLYHCLTRSDTINEEALLSLRKMNILDLAFGSESGSDKMLQAMNKKTTVRQNLHAINIINKFGYKPNTSLVIGFPGETKETLRNTCDYIEQIRPNAETIDIYPVIPYPGTPLWQIFMEKYHPDLSIFDWTSLALRANEVDWSKYYLLSNSCSIKDLHGVAMWNSRRCREKKD